MKPKINIIDLRLLERSLYAAIFTIVKIARHYIIFNENVGRVGIKSDTVYGDWGYPTLNVGKSCKKMIFVDISVKFVGISCKF